MPPRPPTRRGARKPPRPPARGRGRVRWAIAASVVAILILVGLAWILSGRDRSPGPITARTLLAEARAALALDRAADARVALERASAIDPTDAEVWRGRLDLLRVLDRPIEALRLGEAGLRAVSPRDRRGILQATTLAVLAEPPDDEARKLLGRWIAADPDDLDARVARLARIANNPHPDDPDRIARIAELSEILGRDPGQIPAREALATALADAGDVDRGRQVLDAWPSPDRDARYDRLRGRWEIDYDHRPDQAAESFRRALAGLPHDWKIHYGLARALRALGQGEEAQAEAQAVARLRERLEPTALGQRLAADLARPDDPRTLNDLAALTESVGLAGLAQAWRNEALRPPSH
ncbi:tetratricopeptide repeat protein [Tundrisphaera lichenicola]|uniref:tetratricopeptide repeat protein n=1 Tax=Tundrisphaera lichenicola TaxID=2029860 RepID=UPI003EB97EFA